jgi:hypothetical protein
MATLSQQQKLAELEQRLKLLDAAEAQLLASKTQGAKVEASEPVDDMRPSTMGSSTGFYKPSAAAAKAAQTRSAPELGGFVADMAMEGGGATAGAMIGAIPALSVPTGGLSIPLGAGIGALIGNAGAQRRRGQDYSVGEAVGSALGSAIAPGSGTMVRSGIKALAKEGGRQAISNVAGVTAESVIERQELPSLADAGIAAGAAAVGTGLNARATKGTKVAAEELKKAQGAERDWWMDLGSQAGYTYDTAMSNPNMATKMVTAIGGASEIHKAAINNNQQVTNKLVRQELGMPENWPIGEASVNRAIKDASVPYEKLRKLGSAADSLVDELVDTRRIERDSWKAWRAKGGAELKNDAVEAGRKAEKLENDLEVIARGSNSPGLVDELRAGREKLGKLYVVQIAGNLPAGNVDATILADLNKENPNKLTGGFKTAATSAAIQEHMFKAGEKSTPAASHTAQVAGGFMGAGSGGSAGYALGGPAGGALGATLGAGAGVMVAGIAKELITQPFQKIAIGTMLPGFQKSFGIPRYQLDALEAIPTYLLNTTKAAGRLQQDDELAANGNARP